MVSDLQNQRGIGVVAEGPAEGRHDVIPVLAAILGAQDGTEDHAGKVESAVDHRLRSSGVGWWHFTCRQCCVRFAFSVPYCGPPGSEYIQRLADCAPLVLASRVDPGVAGWTRGMRYQSVGGLAQ